MFADLLSCAGTSDWLAAELEPLHHRQRLVALGLAAGTMLLVIELVRRRKLREEYAWVWLATSAAVVVLAIDEHLLLMASGWIGAASPVSTLFFGALVFLFGLCVQFSVRLSRLTHRQRTLGQRIALLEQELRDLRGKPSSEVLERGVAESGRDEVA